MISAAAMAQGDARCSLPGEQVIEDPEGDGLLSPSGEGFGDIVSLHLAEPDAATLVFTYKMSDLATLPPSTLWVVIFQTDVPPADGNEYFVAMLTDPTGAPQFVHGTAAPADASQPALRLFTPVGALAANSAFAADGAITLALEKSLVGGLTPGGFMFGFIPITHRITPTDGTMPFTYGIRGLTASPVQFAYDDAPDGFYELTEADSCDGKSGILGAGALPLMSLLPLLALAGLGRRRK